MGHPAFANEPKPATQNGQPALAHTPSLIASVSSPPPLPEGWIAHLDQNSGQYYYIHLATQATQWEFPKGPNPIEPRSRLRCPRLLLPTATLSRRPTLAAASSRWAPIVLTNHAWVRREHHERGGIGYANRLLGFSGPPPSAGVDMYKMAPTERRLLWSVPPLCQHGRRKGRSGWAASCSSRDAPQPPTIHIHLSVDLSPEPAQLVPHNIFTHQRWTFYKYDIGLQMGQAGTERWTYAVTSHLGCTRYEFVVAGRHETGWRMIAHSAATISLPVPLRADRAKLGGVGFMWKDVLQKNVEMRRLPCPARSWRSDLRRSALERGTAAQAMAGHAGAGE